MRHFFCDGTQIQNPQMFRCLKCRREKNLNFPHEKDARTPRAAHLLLCLNFWLQTKSNSRQNN